MGSVCSSFSTPAPKSDKSKGFGGSVSDLPKNSMIDDFLMDFGFKEKNVQYGRDLAERQARSKAATAAMMKSNNNDSSAPAATVTATDTATTTDTATDTTTTLDTETDTALTNVETISNETFGNDTDFKGKQSTILTKPGGLLGDGEEEDKKKRRRRSLIG